MTAVASLILAAGALRVLFALYMPAWQSPDEYPHYWVAEQIAETGTLPHSRPEFPRYEAFQPPLYYVTAAAILTVVPGEVEYSMEAASPPLPLLVLRFLSVLLGGATVWIAYRTFAARPDLHHREALLCAAFLAFLPTYVGVTSSVNNDALAVFLSALCLYYAMKPIWTRRTALLAGLWGGAALLSKMTALMLLPFLAFRAWQTAGDDLKTASRRIAWAGLSWIGGALLLLARNLYQYGDLLAVRPGVEKAFSFSVSHVLWALRNLTWSFWLALGKTYDITLPPAAYVLTFGLLMLIAALGWVWAWKKRMTLLFTTTVAAVLGVAASLYFTLSYPPGTVTSWGKNLYPFLPLFAVLAVVGWRSAGARLRLPVATGSLAFLLGGSLWGLFQLVSMT